MLCSSKRLILKQKIATPSLIKIDKCKSSDFGQVAESMNYHFATITRHCCNRYFEIWQYYEVIQINQLLL